MSRTDLIHKRILIQNVNIMHLFESQVTSDYLLSRSSQRDRIAIFYEIKWQMTFQTIREHSRKYFKKWPFIFWSVRLYRNTGYPYQSSTFPGRSSRLKEIDLVSLGRDDFLHTTESVRNFFFHISSEILRVNTFCDILYDSLSFITEVRYRELLWVPDLFHILVMRWKSDIDASWRSWLRISMICQTFLSVSNCIQNNQSYDHSEGSCFF